MENKEMVDKIVEQLVTVRNKFIQNNNELLVSVRKDVVATTLKDIIQKSKTYEELKLNLQNYIDTLYTFNKEDNKDEGRRI